MRAVSLIVTVLLAPSLAAAQVLDAEVTAEARPRFELATTLYDQGRYSESAAEFQRVWELTEEPAVLYNAYLAWRNAGQPARAAEALREYLAREPDIEDRDRLERALAELQDEPEPEPEPEPDPDPEPDPLPERAPDLGGPIALLTSGGGLLVVAAVTGSIALALRGNLDTACVMSVCPESSGGDRSGLWATSVITDVAWIGGAIAAAAGLGWLIAALGESSSRVTAGCGPEGCGAMVEGRL